jgi:hypothetical protein
MRLAELHRRYARVCEARALLPQPEMGHVPLVCTGHSLLSLRTELLFRVEGMGHGLVQGITPALASRF